MSSTSFTVTSRKISKGSTTYLTLSWYACMKRGGWEGHCQLEFSEPCICGYGPDFCDGQCASEPRICRDASDFRRAAEECLEAAGESRATIDKVAAEFEAKALKGYPRGSAKDAYYGI